jgi:hypothetical protein
MITLLQIVPESDEPQSLTGSETESVICAWQGYWEWTYHEGHTMRRAQLVQHEPFPNPAPGTCKHRAWLHSIHVTAWGNSGVVISTSNIWMCKLPNLLAALLHRR